MGNGVKVLLVALLVVSVVVVAKVVTNNDGSEDTTNAATGAGAMDAKKSKAKTTNARKAAGQSTSKNSVVSKTPSRTPSKKLDRTTKRKDSSNSLRRSTTPSGQGPVALKPSNPSRQGRQAPRGPLAGQLQNKQQSTTRQPKTPLTAVSPQTTGSQTSASRSGDTQQTTPKSKSDRSRENVVALDVKAPVTGSGGFSPVAPLKTSTDTRSTGSAEVGARAKDPRAEVITTVVATARNAKKDVVAKRLGDEKTTARRNVGSNPGSKTSRGDGKEKPTGRFPAQYVVKRGDSYWALAEKYYKAGKYHQRISKANGAKKLKPGMKISIPAPPAVSKKRKAFKATGLVSASPGVQVTTTPPAGASQPSKPSAKRMRGDALDKLPQSSDGRYVYYVVRKGDTLDGIARRFLKKGAAEKILQANRSLYYTSLKAGERIRIPKG